MSRHCLNPADPHCRKGCSGDSPCEYAAPPSAPPAAQPARKACAKCTCWADMCERWGCLAKDDPAEELEQRLHAAEDELNRALHLVSLGEIAQARGYAAEKAILVAMDAIKALRADPRCTNGPGGERQAQAYWMIEAKAAKYGGNFTGEWLAYNGWTGRRDEQDVRWEWTRDPQAALHFAREIDAHNMVAILGLTHPGLLLERHAGISEHMDMDAARPAAQDTADAVGEARKLRDILRRNGFVECDIEACACGSWHQRYGWPERMREIREALTEAGHPPSNDNGNLPINALKELIAELARLRSAGGPPDDEKKLGRDG